MSVAVIACGALAAHVHEIADRRNLTLRIEPINPLLHNRPEGIAPEVEKMILELQPTHDQVAIAYADCGTYGAIDALLLLLPTLSIEECIAMRHPFLEFNIFEFSQRFN